MERIDYTREHDLTVEEIKACPSFAHFTDEQAEEAVQTLKTFTKIVFDFHKNTAKNLENPFKNRILKT